MDKFSHYLSMASIAEVWNELADDAIGHPLEGRVANRSSDLTESNLEEVE